MFRCTWSKSRSTVGRRGHSITVRRGRFRSVPRHRASSSGETPAIPHGGNGIAEEPRARCGSIPPAKASSVNSSSSEETWPVPCGSVPACISFPITKVTATCIHVRPRARHSNGIPITMSTMFASLPPTDNALSTTPAPTCMSSIRATAVRKRSRREFEAVRVS